MSIAAEGGSTPLTVPGAAARVLEFTQAARVGDLPLILNALSTAELTAGVARLGPRLPAAVIDHVITNGPRVARNTLAWQLRLSPRPPVGRLDFFRVPDVARDHAVQRDHDAVHGHDAARRRLLNHADPDIDRALFGRLEQGGIAWVRSAILRDRVGPDGEPIVPPDLRAKLAAFLGTAVLPLSPSHLADTDTGNPEFELLRVLAGARDPSLSLPASRVLGLPGPIPAGQPGWRDQVWVQRWDKAGVYQLAAAAPNVERLHFLLKELGKHLGPDTSAILYGRLAEQAGPEPVWDVAVLAAGALENVDQFVRSSMSTGEIRPLVIAAGLAGQRRLPGVTVPDPDRLAAPHPEDPARWPLEIAVRQHLDNDPHRWRIMVRRLMEAGPLEYAQLVDLVQAVGDGAGEAAEGEP
jgi:hypothetical protein